MSYVALRHRCSRLHGFDMYEYLPKAQRLGGVEGCGKDCGEHDFLCWLEDMNASSVRKMEMIYELIHLATEDGCGPELLVSVLHGR